MGWARRVGAPGTTDFGYTAMCEQTPVRQLVHDLAGAEQAGFDFSVMSDHYFPWIEEQGHSGYAWSVLGAATQVTERRAPASCGAGRPPAGM